MKQFKVFLTLATVILFMFGCSEPDSGSKESSETPKKAVTSIRLSPTSVIIAVSSSETLKATVSPKDAENAEVTWTSSDENVATVSNDGVVTGKGVGTATITAEAGGKSATCEVTVKEKRAAANSWETLLPSDYKLNNEFWDNASVYFVITDRFYNGDENNDESYGREKGNPTKEDDAGKFYGGDIAGLTAKLDYLEELGINAIWITAPYEQIHGFCIGGNSEFFHYPYHGYYAMDYTNMDASMGTVEDFRTFVNEAHKKGIRIVMDVVMNHPGYNTIEDAKHLYPGVLKDDFVYGTTQITTSNYHDYIDYGKEAHGWDDWWGGDWIRAGLCNHYHTGSGDLTGSSGGSLPDFITENNFAVKLPNFLTKKHTAEAEIAKFYPTEGYNVVKLEENSNYRVRDYLIYWLSSWVREFGIDGFRCDTAKHVEKEAWYQLKVACTQALRDWKNENSDKKVDDNDFWMTGEHWGHSVTKDAYYTEGGFDSMINFSFRLAAKNALTTISDIDTTYSSYAENINSDPAFNVLSYISSHDTGAQDSNGLFYSAYSKSAEKQMIAGSLLAMCPGAIQVYYGDEAGRKDSDASFKGDDDQKNRSQMPWKSVEAGYNAALNYTFDENIHAHWSKVLNFRKNHTAVGAGVHKKIDLSAGYAFSREKGNDKVVVVLGAAEGEVTVDVSSIGAAKVKDFYTGEPADVTNGKATFMITDKNNGTLLIEAAQ